MMIHGMLCKPRMSLGFIGTGTTPTPISDEEIRSLQKRMSIEEPKYQIDVEIGTCKITDGPFKNFEGKVSDVDEAWQGQIMVNMFGRNTGRT